MTRLLIVESPAKARTIQGFFPNQDLHVVACSGHVRDLPSGRLGVDLDKGYAPEWVITADDRVMERLRNAVKASDEVLIGTDADREGEAIAWHLRELIQGWKQVSCRRVRFREVTLPALHRAVSDVREGDAAEIRMGTVHAQFARRIVDRLIGFSLSPRLWADLRPGASIGRVQAAAINVAHQATHQSTSGIRPPPQEQTRRVRVRLKLCFEDAGRDPRGNGVWNWQSEPLSAEAAEALADALGNGVRFRLENCVFRDVTEEPPTPAGTAALIEEAEARWGMVPAATMQAAQRLYEGIEDESGYRTGLITYPRTDSQAVAPAAREAAERWIQERWPKAQVVRRRAELVGAHEAIRPTRPELEPRDVRVSTEAHRVYELVWRRLMLACLPGISWREYRARLLLPGLSQSLFATGRELMDDGWRGVSGIPGPHLKQGEPSFPGWLVDYVGDSGAIEVQDRPMVVAEDGEKTSGELSRGRFIRLLSDAGVGRPSTWVGALEALESRGYLKQDETLQPGPLSFEVAGWLERNASWLLELSFTRRFECWLDEIEDGGRSWQSVVHHVAERLGEFLPKK